MRAYGLLNHRHTAEMEMVSAASVLFTPHLVAMSRGILATCTARLRAGAKPSAVRAAWEQAYAAEPFVHLLLP